MSLFLSRSEAETTLIASRLARRVKPGDVIALNGTLGVGKTAFCRGFIQSFLPKTEVPSPTFTLLQTYDTPDFSIYHFDMYRLKSPEEAYEIGIEDAFAEGVSLIEWPEKLGYLLPKKHISVSIEIHNDVRQICIEGID
ncbi:MAG: tRNA (adenosine(37)-N6)-threonylcarbamoyltransferase complex ATPase subunit type 1 TsaE [Alphaproteobacteria bacterium]|nr:tRNA (adenosine(37)-N6)-threonylcarbamoyltransferase complex ATPase subunit type 1 TsaE [Alphaproteobacteria bacterium]